MEGTLSIKIALLAHYGGNIGHEFMAEGIKKILHEYFAAETLEIDIYEQHDPFSVLNNNLSKIMTLFRPGRGNFLKKILLSPRINNFIINKKTSNVKNYDLAIVVGGPSIVAEVGKAVDMLLLEHFMPKIFKSKKIPVLNISNGSCFPLESTSDTMSIKDSLFWKEAFTACDYLTVRDKVAQNLLNTIGYKADLIACPALYSAVDFTQYGQKNDEYIVINYQLKGANEDWGQNVDPISWKNIITAFVEKIQEKHKVVFLCHNAGEEKIAKQLKINNIEIFYPHSIEEYAKIALKAKAALVSRIHAAIPLASAGVPSIVIGTDTRLGTVENIGLETFFVKNVTVEKLIERFEIMLNDLEDRKKTLKLAREKVRNDYFGLIQKALEGKKHE